MKRFKLRERSMFCRKVKTDISVQTGPKNARPGSGEVGPSIPSFGPPVPRDCQDGVNPVPRRLQHRRPVPELRSADGVVCIRYGRTHAMRCNPPCRRCILAAFSLHPPTGVMLLSAQHCRCLKVSPKFIPNPRWPLHAEVRFQVVRSNMQEPVHPKNDKSTGFDVLCLPRLLAAHDDNPNLRETELVFLKMGKAERWLRESALPGSHVGSPCPSSWRWHVPVIDNRGAHRAAHSVLLRSAWRNHPSSS
jgi:hypothetical protein